MAKKIWQFASYHLWSLFVSAVGQEAWHCDRKRGYMKVKNKEPQVEKLLNQDTDWQKIGLLAQKGVYEFHQDSQLLQKKEGIDRVAQILQLPSESAEVAGRVRTILENYHDNPILLGKDIIKLNSGDEGFPQPILVQQGNYSFNLYAAIDCIFREPDGTLHILDLKTGKTDFDRRQALVYLLACQYLHLKEKAIASFYNLETRQWSSPISANSNQLKAVQAELARIAKKHQQERWLYQQNNSEFNQIYPANSHFNCRYCQFSSICEFSSVEVMA